MATAAPKRVNALMIDDDPEAIMLMGLRLNEAFGADVSFVLEGAETLKDGLAKAGQGDYDVVLLDLNLPDSRGLDTVVAARLKTETTPIVVLTCFEDEDAGLKAISLGAQDYLIKDRLNVVLLGRAVRFAIERSALLREVRELERLRAEVRERLKTDRFKDRLLGAISHDLRSPLTVAQAAVVNLADGRVGALTPAQLELVDMARRNLDRLGRLVLNALDYSRLDSGRAELKFRRVNTRRLVSELTADWRRTLARDLSVELDLPPELAPVLADPDHLARALHNLLDNAGRHAAKAVRVSALSRGAGVRLTVEDDGPGVPPELAEEIFLPYRQLTRGKGPGYKGTGLGLAICREIAGLCSGRVWHEPRDGGGSRFHFELPRWSAQPSQLVQR